MVKAVKFVKNKNNKIWKSEWCIYLDGKYDGFIYKCSDGGDWNIFCQEFNIRATNPIPEQKTLAAAKRIIREFVETSK